MDEAHLVAFMLSQRGFGTPDHVLGMAVDLVLDGLEYCGFMDDYQQAFQKLNTPETNK